MYTDPTHPERPSPFVEEKPVNHFSLMQAEDAQEMSTGDREKPGKPHDKADHLFSS